jgi:hypothetical protein
MPSSPFISFQVALVSTTAPLSPCIPQKALAVATAVAAASRTHAMQLVFNGALTAVLRCVVESTAHPCDADDTDDGNDDNDDDGDGGNDDDGDGGGDGNRVGVARNGNRDDPYATALNTAVAALRLWRLLVVHCVDDAASRWCDCSCDVHSCFV